MRSEVTEAVGALTLIERAEQPQPGQGEVLIAPEAVWICGSDYHFFLGSSQRRPADHSSHVFSGMRLARANPQRSAPGAVMSWPSGSSLPCGP